MIVFLLGVLFLVSEQASSSEVSPGLANEPISFSPKPGTVVHLSVNQNAVTVTLISGAATTVERIDIETEKKVTARVADYNFDGYQDFSLSHLDDGMGTYRIYQIYVFSPAEKKFVQLKPSCGDEFINVTLSKPEQRRLFNSYFSDNGLKTCAVTY